MLTAWRNETDGSSYLLTTTALQPTFGKIYGIFNIKYTYLIAVGIFELGSLVTAAAPTSNAFIVGRALAGVRGGAPYRLSPTLA